MCYVDSATELYIPGPCLIAFYCFLLCYILALVANVPTPVSTQEAIIVVGSLYMLAHLILMTTMWNRFCYLCEIGSYYFYRWKDWGKKDKYLVQIYTARKQPCVCLNLQTASKILYVFLSTILFYLPSPHLHLQGLLIVFLCYRHWNYISKLGTACSKFKIKVQREESSGTREWAHNVYKSLVFSDSPRAAAACKVGRDRVDIYWIDTECLRDPWLTNKLLFSGNKKFKIFPSQ